MDIAVIEDSKTLAHIVSSALKSYSYLFSVFKSDEISVQKIDTGNYKLIVMNTNPDHLEVSTFLQSVNKRLGDVAVLGVINKGSWKERVEFLTLGGDDVITYPFPLQELIVRIDTLLKREKDTGRKRPKEYKFRDICLNPYKRVVTVRDKPVPMSQKEFNLLEYMLKNQERPISRMELLDNVWDYKRVNSSNTVDVHVSNLRRLLPDPDFIKTIHGFGYQLKESGDLEEEVEEEFKEPPEL